MFKGNAIKDLHTIALLTIHNTSHFIIGPKIMHVPSDFERNHSDLEILHTPTFPARWIPPLECVRVELPVWPIHPNYVKVLTNSRCIMPASGRRIVRLVQTNVSGEYSSNRFILYLDSSCTCQLAIKTMDCAYSGTKACHCTASRYYAFVKRH